LVHLTTPCHWCVGPNGCPSVPSLLSFTPLTSEFPMRIAFVSAEAAPYAKVGGLADVAGSLPQALAALGHEVALYLPLHGQIDRSRLGIPAKGQTWSAPFGASEARLGDP